MSEGDHPLYIEGSVWLEDGCAAIHTSQEGVRPSFVPIRLVDSFLISFPAVLKFRTLNVGKVDQSDRMKVLGCHTKCE